MSQVSPSGDARSLGAMFDRVQAALTAFLAVPPSPVWEGRKIVIYGAGSFGRSVAGALLKRNAAVLGFLDQKGTGQTVLGELRSYSPRSAEAKHWADERPAALIGTHNPKVPLQGIARLLQETGFTTVVTPMEIYRHLDQELGWCFWLGNRRDYEQAATCLDRTRALWADAESERLFLETLLYRLAFDLEMAATVSGAACQYAHPTVPRWSDPLRMVDGGAYTGDTLRSLLGHGYDFASLHAFEPDLENFRKLRDCVFSLLPKTPSSIWPCGVSSSTDRLKFSEGSGTSSKLCETGSAQVPVVALDDVLHGQALNLIKLDIEGAELDALQGARRLIEKNRPGIAVCLYHFPHHLWAIPLWLAELDLRYRFYYRAHEHCTFETVLYALPL